MSDAVVYLPMDRLVRRPPAEPPPPRGFRERAMLARAPSFWPALAGKPPLSPVMRAGLMRLADSICGAGEDAMVAALVEAMRHSPAGDVVEVGSGSGRTAAVLTWLARRYQVGAVLCLDAWTEGGLAEFDIALAPLAEGDCNRQRLPAADYGPDFVVASETFGETRYAGRIALLHLDAGDADPAAWTPHVIPGGWLVFGPALTDAAESYAAAKGERICASFTADGATFIQLKR